MSVSCACCVLLGVSAMGRSLVQRSATECGVCLSVIKDSYDLNTYNEWVEEVRLKKKRFKVTTY